MCVLDFVCGCGWCVVVCFVNIRLELEDDDVTKKLLGFVFVVRPL